MGDSASQARTRGEHPVDGTVLGVGMGGNSGSQYIPHKRLSINILLVYAVLCLKLIYQKKAILSILFQLHGLKLN